MGEVSLSIAGFSRSDFSVNISSRLDWDGGRLTVRYSKSEDFKTVTYYI